MTTLYADSIRLHLRTGDEVQAFVRAAPSGGRAKCLLLHGNPATLRDWEPVVPLLGEVDIAAIDLPGFGRSPRTDRSAQSVSLERFAACSVAVGDALSWREPFFIVGHSHGGGVAQVAAALYPERVAGVVLIGTLGALQHASYRLLSLPFAETAIRWLASALRSTSPSLERAMVRSALKKAWSPEPVPAARLERELALYSSKNDIWVTMAQAAQGNPCELLARCARRIRCPVSFLHGEADAMVPLACARAAHELILEAGGSSELDILPRAGHALLESRPEEVARHILRFVRVRSDRCVSQKWDGGDVSLRPQH